MRLTVTIEGKTLTAELENLDARPVVVWVEGERFEVWLQEETVAAAAFQSISGSATEAREVRSAPAIPAASQPAGGADHALRAPIPGIIGILYVNAGDQVTVGQIVCVLEAMKMKNTIRSNREGRIAEVRVSAGQQVNHNDILLVFED